jgi:HK97 family phage major capsid protein
MKRITDLKTDIALNRSELKKIMDAAAKEKRARTPEEVKRWDDLKAEIDLWDQELTSLMDEDERNRRNAVAIGGPQYMTNEENPVFTIQERTKPNGQISDWYLRNHEVPEHLQKITPGAFIRAKISGPKTELEKRAVNETTDSQGGFYVPEVLMSKIMDNVRAKSHVLSSGAQTILLDSKNQKMAKIIGDPTAAWVAESGTISASDPTFDSVDWSAKKLVSRIDVTGEWLQDAMNADKAIQMTLEGALSGELDRSALIGSGSGEEPLGIFGYSNVNVYTMDANGAAIEDYDPFLEVIKLMYDDNSETPNTAIMAPRTWLALSKFKDQQDQPLQLPPALKNLAFKQTSKIPVNQTQGSSSAASSVFLGGFENLYLGLRLQMQIIPTFQLVATKYEFSFLAVLRADWQPLRDQAFGIIKGII